MLSELRKPVDRLRPLKRSEFADSAPAANPVFYRTYSRKKEDEPESFTGDRVVKT